MLITVAICTRDRAPLLEQTLAGLAEIAIPTGVDCELLVVNNGSCDHTDAVIASFGGRVPVRRLFEPRVIGLRTRFNPQVTGAENVRSPIMWRLRALCGSLAPCDN